MGHYTTGTVRERLVALTAEELGLTREEIVDESTLAQDMAADSLETKALAMEIEDEFGVEISDTEELGWRTFGDVLAMVEAKVAELP